MAKTGRPSKPPELKVLHGDRKRTIKAVPKSRPSFDAKAPAHLSFDAQKAWKDIIPKLERMGILTEIDTDAIAIYCDAYSRWVEARQALAIEGYYWTSDKGNKCYHPMVTIMNDAIKQMHTMQTEFGMTPRARNGISVKKDEELDLFAELLD